MRGRTALVQSLHIVFVVAFVALMTSFVSLAVAEDTINTSEPVLRTLQTPFTATGTTRTRSITFLSSGYQDAALFWDDVNRCISALHNNSGGIITDPWTRYVDLFTIYGVYERSAGLGATRLQGPLHSCAGMNQCSGERVENNLDCMLGTPNPHYMSCSISAVAALAARAPQQDIVVVLVNVNETSAMATDGVAYLANEKEYMIYFLLHFLNRAVAGLQEEYSLGFAETRNPEKYARANCAVSAESAEVKWGYWDDVEARTPPADADAAGCTFSNFVAPFRHRCVMRNSSANAMCPVCQEALTRAFFQNGVNRSALPSAAHTPLNLLAGQCPPADRILYVDPDADDAVVASAGPFAAKSYVSVCWFIGTKQIGEGPTLVFSNLANLTFPTTIRVTLTDRSPYLRRTDEGTAAFVQQSSLFVVDRRRADVLCESPALTCLTDIASSSGAPGAVSTCTVYTPNNVFATLAKQHAMLSQAGADFRASEANASKAEEPAGTTLPPIDPDAQDPPYKERDVIIAACVSGGVALIVTFAVTLFYFCSARKNPREVLNVRRLDRFFYVALCLSCLAVLALSVLVIVFSVVYIPIQFVFGRQVFIVGIVIGAVMFVIAMLNYCGALFRWFKFCAACCILYVLGGIGLFAVGTYCVWAYMNRYSDSLSGTVGRLWVRTAATSGGRKYLCDVQESMKCSGYHASCVLAESSECVDGCASNAYTTACEIPFLHFVGGNYYPVGILCVVGGFLLVITAALDMFYFLSFTQLSRAGKLRRSFRNDPKAPIIPVTYNEADTVSKMFKRVCAQDETLTGQSAVRFLESVFGETLSKDYSDLIHKSGPLTFDELMSMHFPFVMSSSIDPRMLTPDTVEKCMDMVELEKKQYHKQQRFINASGTLSPAALYLLFQSYGKKRFLPNEDDILQAIEMEASRPSEDAAMLRGLTPRELEGLRGAWVTLHPTIVGSLTDEEIDLLYQWSHGEVLKDAEAFDAWKRKLDVRKKGEVGWIEFCYPYAQNAALQKARVFLSDHGKEVPPEVLSRDFVEEKYGHDVAERVLFPLEEELPVERLLAYFLGDRQTGAADASKEELDE